MPVEKHGGTRKAPIREISKTHGGYKLRLRRVGAASSCSFSFW